MLKTRLLLIGICAVLIVVLFQLPKAVVENQSPVTQAADSIKTNIESHIQAPKELTGKIQQLRNQWLASASQEEKNAIFADSLATLYRSANRFDSAAWFAEETSRFFNKVDKWIQAGDDYYQAYTLAIDQTRQRAYAAKAQEFYGRVLKAEPDNFSVKTRLAMTYISSANPMQGISMLREVLAADPQNREALFSMGMLSIQSGQHTLAVQYLERLIAEDASHIQGQLLLGIALMNIGEEKRARTQFEKVKQMDKDPAVQATVDSYLKDLK